MKNYKILTYGCFLILLSTACNQQKKYQLTKNNVRDIHALYDAANNTEKLDSLYKTSADETNADIRAAHVYNYFTISPKFDGTAKVEKLDSIMVSSDFNDLHDINKFYLYYGLANYQYQIGMAEQSVINIKKAGNFINSSERSYSAEKIKLKDLIRDHSQISLENLDLNIKKSIQNLKESKTENIGNSSLGLHYKIAQSLMKKNDFKSAKSYIYPAIAVDSVIEKSILGMQQYRLLASAHIGLKEWDSLELLKNEVDKWYQDKKINRVTYDGFLTDYYTGVIQNVDNKEAIAAELTKMTEEYPMSCSNMQIVNDIYSGLALVYKVMGVSPKEKQAIYNLQEAITSCHFNELPNEQKHQLKLLNKRLIELESISGNKENLQHYYSDLKKLNEQINNEKKLYIEFTEGMSTNDLRLFKTDLNNKKVRIEKNKRLNQFYGLLVVLAILLALVLWRIHRKSVSLKRQLNEKSEALRNQNKKIALQNQKTAEVADAIKESNHKLEKFAITAAHDIKNPLSTIKNAINYLMEKYQENNEAKDQDVFKNLNSIILALTDMINYFLGMSNSQNKKENTTTS